jgi:hypothetical protein
MPKSSSTTSRSNAFSALSSNSANSNKLQGTEYTRAARAEVGRHDRQSLNPIRNQCAGTDVTPRVRNPERIVWGQSDRYSREWAFQRGDLKTPTSFSHIALNPAMKRVVPGEGSASSGPSSSVIHNRTDDPTDSKASQYRPFKRTTPPALPKPSGPPKSSIIHARTEDPTDSKSSRYQPFEKQRPAAPSSTGLRPTPTPQAMPRQTPMHSGFYGSRSRGGSYAF